MKNRASDDFEKVLAASEIVAENLPGHVFIGGVAVYLHTVNNPKAKGLAEASHDADVMVSLTDLSYLRDVVEVVANPRLRKNQVIVEGVEVDIYVERHHGLVVPYDELVANSVKYGPLSVACPEHLMVLKLYAGADRSGSSKGDKDERDVVRLATMGWRWRPELVSPYVGKEHLQFLEQVSRSRIFSVMCERDEHEAAKLRKTFEKFLQKNF